MSLILRYGFGLSRLIYARLGRQRTARRFFTDQCEDAALGVVELGARDIARARHTERDGFADTPRPAGHDDDLVAEHQRLIDAVRSETNCPAVLWPDVN